MVCLIGKLTTKDSEKKKAMIHFIFLNVSEN